MRCGRLHLASKRKFRCKFNSLAWHFSVWPSRWSIRATWTMQGGGRCRRLGQRPAAVGVQQTERLNCKSIINLNACMHAQDGGVAGMATQSSHNHTMRMPDVARLAAVWLPSGFRASNLHYLCEIVLILLPAPPPPPLLLLPLQHTFSSMCASRCRRRRR